MDAIVIAGGAAQPGQPLYPLVGGQPKARLPVCGKPMIQWVLDALDNAQTIERVVIVGLADVEGLRCAKLAAALPDQGGMLENIRYGVRRGLAMGSGSSCAAIVSSDIPAVLPEQVDWVVRSAEESEHDLYYNVVRRAVMERRFPGSNRSYVRLKDAEVCGGDLNVIRKSMATVNEELWGKIIAARKNALKQAALLGFDTLFLLIFRLMSLQDAVERVSRRVGVRGRALDCPYAEIAMDVDKPHQFELVQRYLEERSRGQ
ncbi:MAG: hypothetical protein B6D39_01235 [Anaerolineae bacterium UTCFX2]|nr:nucleotidyltransferase family protein [Anaerolineae bacterium]MCZ7551517.1 NTP transferase domain-containing protein [Anaerolineales bacterium]OQY94567.1 MAG: hypothetical protein B6D39_01235 [Anaerolineae bacterium UTCFX2]